MYSLIQLFLFLRLFGFSYGQIEDKILVDSRDKQEYNVVEINGLIWMQENLRYKSENSVSIINCGEFYAVNEAINVCPSGWRLPKRKEVKSLEKFIKKNRISLLDTLHIELCGRIDDNKHSRINEQTTFWLEEELHEGEIMHWHIFGSEIELHSHNVVQAKRQFPIRCVSETLP